MPYYKRYRRYKRYSKKRYYKKTLKKSSIFGRKSAKSQAKQIYALNKKVNYLAKANKPEIDTMTTDMRFQYENQIGPNGILMPKKYGDGHIALFADHLLNEDETNHFRLMLDDGCDTIKIKNLTLYGDFGFSSFRSVSNQYVIMNNTTQTTSDPRCAYFRILICQCKKSLDNYPHKVFTSIRNIEESDPNVDCSLVQGPLIKGFTNYFKILRKKVIKITEDNPRKMFKFKLRGFTYRRGPEDVYGANEIYIFYQYVSPAVLRYVNSATQEVYFISPEVHWSLNCKLSYNRNPGIHLLEPPEGQAPAVNPNNDAPVG